MTNVKGGGTRSNLYPKPFHRRRNPGEEEVDSRRDVSRVGPEIHN